MSIISEIIQDEQYLRQISKKTSLKECLKLDIFSSLETTLKNNTPAGYGLTAIQIGYPICAGIIRMPKLKLNYFNPKIISQYTKVTFKGEGCLSFPGKYVTTERFHHCEIEYFNERNEKREGILTGLEAVVFEHETDHFKGILFFDRQIKPYKKEVDIGRNSPCPECLKKGITIKYKKCKLHFN